MEAGHFQIRKPLNRVWVRDLSEVIRELYRKDLDDENKT